MTTTQKTILATLAAIALLVILAVAYQERRASSRRAQEQTLRQQYEQQAALSNQVRELQRERDQAVSALAAASAENARKNPNEVLKLRGEVGRLRQEKAEISSQNALSKITANPESRKLLRDQQRMGMGAIYKKFASDLKLAPDQTEKLKDLLADHIMEDVGHVTTILRDKLPPERMEQLFAAEDAALREQVQALLGPEGLAQYQDYTRNLLSRLTAEQFKGMLTGSGTEKEEKTNRLRQALQEAAQGALAQAGLPEDYQTLPILNFSNIASEAAAERSLKLLEDIYQRAAAQGGSFLNAEDIAKFQEFKTTALNNSRTALTLNRTMMAPISD